MIAGIVGKYKIIDEKLQIKVHLSIFECLIVCGCILSAIVMFIRVFYGTELTDEAYYVSDAIAMVHGNIPYAYNNYSYGTGSAFLLIPLVFIYELLVPSNEGIFLFTRICYIFFWYAALLFGYRILRRDFKKSSALLVTGFLIPYAGGGTIFNFSYNTVPCALSYIAGLTIYDAVEHKNKFYAIKLYFSGFLMGIAFFAQPGYAIAIATFAAIILFRGKGLKDKVRDLSLCLAGGITEILMVVIPIMIQSSPAKLIAGIRYKFNPYPTGTMYSRTTKSRIDVIVGMYKQYLPLMVCIFLFVLLFSLRYIREEDKKLSKKEYVLLAASAAIFLLTAFFCRSQSSVYTDNVNMYWGFVGSIGMAVLLLTFDFKKYPIILYLGIYPVLFSIVEVVVVDSEASISRYVAAVPVMAVYLLIMLNKKSELIRIIATVSVVACILSMGIIGFRYIYRDEHFSALDYQVGSGVYKGLYTSEARAHDLPELEEYLNSIVEDGEYYAFRDNVPAAYLMMHHGIMCDKATWDCLNYSYKKNAPAQLYEYYQRREAFPEKYIYIDYGRDEQMSIEEDGFLFNEFIDSYYTKTADFELNSTFSHVIVYEYKGGFDGDFDYWIERHMYRGE